MNVSKGWNLVYDHDYYSDYNDELVTTDLPKDNTFEWWLECRYDDD